ncbi:Holliday junction branch migration protein RuvA [Stratiformator vulcanicus]|uniref:Holliday junction branch migration complex subunit RuvA n=1 Tax=Stratiformator vulcanicus TaxID=2527980 RepID=A0A517R3T5_9PLAN|nr:Holliday junction branch migration protein RuvA [Stratiformator vulcanicus]QDT38526.1 Holliday junction ATP-dependent DNA helicase RuvA [Stratiformator vulcanicus]
MITRISGILNRVSDSEAFVQAGHFEYEVLIPDFVRRQVQPLMGNEVHLRTIEYLEGNPQKGRLTPRLVGFLSDAERDFFDLICSVDGVGVRKALRAMVRPVREVAHAIEEQDTKQLSTLPGIGPAMAERIVAKLRRKMTRFALMADRDLPADSETGHDVLTEAAEALIALGHTPADASAKVESVVQGGKKFKSVEDLLMQIYQRENG